MTLSERQNKLKDKIQIFISQNIFISTCKGDFYDPFNFQFWHIKLIRSNKTKEAAEMVKNGECHEIPAR